MIKTKQEWKIGDCLELLPSISDKSIDMILTDLPYGVTACDWDIIIPFEPLWKEYKRIIKDNGNIVLTASQPFTSKLIISNIDMFKYCWVWEKSQGVNFVNAKNTPLKIHEDILVFSPGTCANKSNKKMKYFPQEIIKYHRKRHVSSKKDTYLGDRPNQDNKEYIQQYKNYPTSIIFFPKSLVIHPTQKPIALFEYLIKTYTNEGDMVHDSCLGSGTTLEACMNLNRNCIGFEIDPQWEEIYKKRLLLGNVRFI